MRIVTVHNRYQERGGEDAVFEAESALLEEHGHAVARVLFDNDEIAGRTGPLDKARLALDTIWSRDAAAQIRARVREHRAEVVHFHNTFPLISPAAYAAARAEGAAVVQSLHNYRLLCVNGSLYRDEGVCTDCVGRALPWPGVQHACYRGSRAASLTAAAMLSAHRLRDTWRRDVDAFIAPAAFVRDTLLAAGLPARRVLVKPHFIHPDPGPRPATSGDRFVYVGRLVENKGVRTLLDAWRDGTPPPLTIVGTGPMSAEVAQAAAKRSAITATGLLDRAGVLAAIDSARALLVPSTWYEIFGVVVIEAFARGVPVITTRIGALPEIVEDRRTGLLVPPGDPAALRAAVDWAWTNPEALRQMGVEARRVYEERYAGERNHALLTQIYARAIARRQRQQ